MIKLHMWTISRAWKNHLRGIAEEYRVKLYQTLSLLESERSTVSFQEQLSKFIQYWKDKVPAFIQYFREYYANRPGRWTSEDQYYPEQPRNCGIKVYPLNLVFPHWTEKWASCYRHFVHADTDTNMYLERYGWE